MSAIIFKNQAVTVSLTTNLDISGADSNVIKYKKPKGSTVYEFSSPTRVGNTLSQKMVPDSTGEWRFWIGSTWGTDYVPSTVAVMEVFSEGCQ